jgi:type III secretion protein Q
MKAEAHIKDETQELLQPAMLGPGPDSEDPFAEDLFAARKLSEGDPTGPAAQFVVSSTWHSRLPKVTTAEAKASAEIATLPSEFYSSLRESVSGVFSRYLISSPDEISVTLTEFYEAEFSAALETQESPRIFANFVCEPNRNPVSIEVDARFSIMLIDRMLGGSGDPPNSLRPLTTAELAVAEFLFLAAASELNQQIGAPLLRLENLSEQPPWATGAVGSAGSAVHELKQRGIVGAFRIDVGQVAGMARTYLPGSSLTQINSALVKLRDAGAHRNSLHLDAKVRGYARIVPDLPLTILIGKTELTREEFTLLECDDVMLVERPDLVWRGGRIWGSLRVRVADGEGTLILGDAADLTQSTIKLKVGSVAIGGSGELGERLNMREENETEDSLSEEANGIDGVMLTVRVELAARRLRLDELSRLRPNQVLDLGCQATDQVDLVVDGRHVAHGELVDIEGRLGVRIKQVSTKVA